jgi:carboxylesterase type B
MPWNATVKAVNCSAASNILACVRAVPQPVLTDVIEHLEVQFRPVIDNVTNRAHPESVRTSGDIAQIPVMTGTNANEGRIFTLPYLNANTSIPYLMQTYHLTTQQAEALASLYPIGSLYISNAYTQIAQIFTDFSFQCPALLLQNDTHAAHLPVWRYLYNGSFPNLNPLPVDLGAYHSSEIPMVFGNYPQVGATDEQRRVSEYMQTSWATFAKNPHGGPGWKGFPYVEVLGPDAMNSGVGYSTPAETLDTRCFAYQPAYRALGVF